MRSMINRLVATTLFVTLCLSCPEYIFGQGQIKKPQKQVKQTSVKISSPDGYLNDYGYVDLGLPSGTKWAVHNIGAENNTDIGNYYSWGERDIKVKYYYNESKTIYKQIDNIAGSTDFDTAKLLWGESWSMPTIDQWKELFLKTKVKYITVNSVLGFLFTGANNKSIFIPFGGYISNGNIVSWTQSGRYWTANADYRYHGSEYPNHPDNAYAAVLEFETVYDKPNYLISAMWRGEGCTVRPVCNK